MRVSVFWNIFLQNDCYLFEILFQIWNCGGGRNGGVNNQLTFNNDNDLAYIVENDTILGSLYKQIHDDQNITVHYDSHVNQCISPKTNRELATVKVANKETTFETSLIVWNKN